MKKLKKKSQIIYSYHYVDNIERVFECYINPFLFNKIISLSYSNLPRIEAPQKLSNVGTIVTYSFFPNLKFFRKTINSIDTPLFKSFKQELIKQSSDNSKDKGNIYYIINCYKDTT